MTSWIAVAYGALDVRGWHENHSGVEVMLLPIFPIDEPIGLAGEPAELWRRMVAGPVDDAGLSAEERQLLVEFEYVGIASRNADHTASVTALSGPVMLSPLHELVYALIANVSREERIRSIFIKGPILHFQGLREKAHSGDVDVLIDPSQIDRLAEAMETWGWTRWPDIWDGSAVNHSITMEPTRWGCEVDLHRHMPGCGESDQSVFETIYDDHLAEMKFAGATAYVPDPTAHAVLAALHSVRPSRESPPSSMSISFAEDMLRRFGPTGLELSQAIGTNEALRPIINSVFPDVDLGSKAHLPLNWTWRSRKSRVVGYSEALRMLPVRLRAKYLLRLIWPPLEVVKATNKRHGLRSSDHPRLVRWKRALGLERH